MSGSGDQGSGSGHEFAFIDAIARRAHRPEWLMVGIGDDAAVMRGLDPLVIAADMIVEGVHFQVPPATFAQVGRKALAINLSDLAAMAALPRAAIVSVALNRSHPPDAGRELMEGMQRLANEYDVAIIGGDTNSWDGGLVVNVTVLGSIKQGEAVRRSGARVGDVVAVTGELGGSLKGHHLDFTPRIVAGQRLQPFAHAMIDVSDGFAADLFHILDESGVGAVVDAAAIPIRADVRRECAPAEALRRALGDGEDFELIVCLDPSAVEAAPRALENVCPLTVVGRIVPADEGRQLVGPDGTAGPLERQGWEHCMGRAD